jgi:hypothetical protein
MFNLDELINNPSKGETYGDVEATIADQMRRFTTAMSNSKNPIEDLKMVVALGFDLWKICGNKVCEDTNMILSHIIRGLNSDMVYQFQQISNNSNNNDICIYLYLALPTINNNLSKEALIGLCNDTIDKMGVAYNQIGVMTNFKSIDVEKVKSNYNNLVNG